MNLMTVQAGGVDYRVKFNYNHFDASVGSISTSPDDYDLVSIYDTAHGYRPADELSHLFREALLQGVIRKCQTLQAEGET